MSNKSYWASKQVVLQPLRNSWWDGVSVGIDLSSFSMNLAFAWHICSPARMPTGSRPARRNFAQDWARVTEDLASNRVHCLQHSLLTLFLQFTFLLFSITFIDVMADMGYWHPVVQSLPCCISLDVCWGNLRIVFGTTHSSSATVAPLCGISTCWIFCNIHEIPEAALLTYPLRLFFSVAPSKCRDVP